MKRKIHLVQRRVIRSTIDSPRPELAIDVMTRVGYQPVQFVLDTGADLTTIPQANALARQIPFTASGRRLAASGVGDRIPSVLGEIQVCVFGRELVWPCVFSESSTRPRSSDSSERNPPNLLGRAGFLTQLCDVLIDDRYLIITHRLSLPRWMRKIITYVYPVWRPTSSDDSI